MARILICHVPHDAPYARELGSALMGRGHTISFDGMPDAPREDRFPRLRHFDTVAVIWTEASVASSGLAGLAREALSLNLLAPALADGVDANRLPIGFRKLIAFRLGDIEGISRFVQRTAAAMKVRRELNKTPTVEDARRRPAPLDAASNGPLPSPRPPIVPRPPSPNTGAVASSAPLPPPLLVSPVSPVSPSVRFAPPPPLSADLESDGAALAQASTPPPLPTSEATEKSSRASRQDAKADAQSLVSPAAAPASPKVRRLSAVANLIPDIGDSPSTLGTEKTHEAGYSGALAEFERMAAKSAPVEAPAGSGSAFAALVAEGEASKSTHRAALSLSHPEEALAAKADQLLYLIPGEMTLNAAQSVVVRLGSAAMLDLVEGGSSLGEGHAGSLPVVLSLSISLHSEAGMEIERSTKTTQRIVPDEDDGIASNLDDAGYWEWTVVPRQPGIQHVSVRVSAFLKDRAGVPFSAALADQFFQVNVAAPKREVPGLAKLKSILHDWTA